MALSEDRETPRRAVNVVATPVASGELIYAGALVALNSSGYLVAGNTATGLTYWGRAEARVDNTGGSDGDVSCQVRRGSAFRFANDGSDTIDQSHVGATAYIVDDETVAANDGGGTRSAAGTIIAVEPAGVWVE